MRVFNKKYWPHQIRLDRPEQKIWLEHIKDQALTDIEHWCYQNFKSADWNNAGYYFVFKRNEDLTFFTLRWT